MKPSVLLAPLLLGLLSFAHADDLTPGRYRVSGTEPGWGSYRGEVVVDGSSRRLRYAGAVRWADGRPGAVRGTVFVNSFGTLVSERLTKGGGMRGSRAGTADTRARVGSLTGPLGSRAETVFAQAGRRGSWRQLSRRVTVRVLSFNVLGFKSDWLSRAGRVAKVIRDARPDVVAFQEVVGQSRGRSAQVNSLAKRAGGFKTRFEGYRKYSFFGPWMGNAVISRWRIEAFQRVPLPRGGPGIENDYPRGVTWARIAHPSGARIDVGSLHLHHRHDSGLDDDLRVRQVRQAMRAFVRRGSALRLLVGDYNARPGSRTVQAMAGAGWRDLWVEARPNDPGYSASVLGKGSPKRIDYVFAKPPAGSDVEAVSARTFGPRTRDGELISDHKAVLVVLSLDVPVGP